MPEPIWPDGESDRALVDWLSSPHATRERAGHVRELLDDVVWRRAWQLRWHATPDVIVPGDWIVRLPDGPVVVVRLFSDEDPEGMFNFRIVVA